MSIKTSLVIGICTLALAACSEPEKKNNSTPPAPKAGDACTSARLNDTACDGATTVIFCDGSVWAVSLTCSGGRVCGDIGAGVISCVSSGGGVTVPECTYSAQPTNFFDEDLFPYHTALAQDAAGRSIELNNWPGWDDASGNGDGVGLLTAGSATLSGDNASYANCGTCVVAYEEVDPQTTRTYLADAGTANFTALPAAAGQMLNVTLTGVHFREVIIDPDTYTHTDVAGGAQFTLEDITITGNADYYPCFMYSGFDVDETYCVTQPAGAIMGCGGDCLRLAEACANGCDQVSAPSQTSPNDPYEAACQ